DPTCGACRTRRAGLRPAASARSAQATASRSTLCRSRSRSSDETCDPFARLFDLLEARRVAGTDVAAPSLAERASRDRDDLLVEEEPLGELLVVHSHRGDVREAVERASRLEAVQPEIVEVLQHHLPAPVVLADHTAHLVFTCTEP